ncbi:MAG: alpha/beta fold hydrolase [Deltaproteobacteria bacterium]|nr:alpha/beta fold hydrolase [Deltaproteobacteria bacterium]
MKLKIQDRKRCCTGILLLILGMLFPCAHLEAVECLFKDPQYSFQCLRTMGYSSTGGADIAECLSTASRITEGDNESWYREWSGTARRLEAAADGFLSGGHEKSAMEACFRASNYYRNAGFFLLTRPDDPRILESWEQSRACFLKAAKVCDRPVKFIRIPYEQTTLPAYLCLVDDSGKKRPLLVVHSGFDGTAEELYFEVASLALERGFHCLLFEGPGQGEVIRRQKIPFRPDWENVVSPVLDVAVKLPEVDPERIALMGISFGGYLAPRAAAYEKRIKACIANGGVYDFYGNAVKKCPPDTEKIIKDKEASKAFDKAVLEGMTKDVDVGWFFANGMYTFQAQSPSEYLRKLKPYHMKDCADRIRCTMLVVDSEGDRDLPGQARQLYDALKCPKEYMLFTKQEGAEEHCQMGAIMISNERILNWLEKVMLK